MSSVTTKPKPRVGAQKIKKTETEHSTTERQQLTKTGLHGGKRNNANAKQPKHNKMAFVNPHISLTTLNLNGLNNNKKARTNTTGIYCLQETHFGFKDIHRLQVKEWNKTFHGR